MMHSPAEPAITDSPAVHRAPGKAVGGARDLFSRVAGARRGHIPLYARPVPAALTACILAVVAVVALSGLSPATPARARGLARVVDAVGTGPRIEVPAEVTRMLSAPVSARQATAASPRHRRPSHAGREAGYLDAGYLDIPPVALSAYARAATVIASAAPRCHLEWPLLAGIGRVESNHGQSGGSRLDAVSGVATPRIFGIRLRHISDTEGGALDGDTDYDRAVGPMQFIPSTWALVGVDADGDGERNPQDVDDSALAAAVYLCAGGADLSTDAGLRMAVFSYNHSEEYVDLVLAYADAYADYSDEGPLVVRAVGGYPTPVPSGSPNPSVTPTDRPSPTTGPTTKVTPTMTAPPTVKPSPTVKPTATPSGVPTPIPTPTPPPTSTPTGTPPPTADPTPTVQPTDPPASAAPTDLGSTGPTADPSGPTGSGSPTLDSSPSSSTSGHLSPYPSTAAPRGETAERSSSRSVRG